MKKKKYFHLLFFILVGEFYFFGGCSHQTDFFCKTEILEFKLPDYPHNTHPTLLNWNIISINEDGKTIYKIPATDESFTLELNKNQPTAIICQPVSKLNELNNEGSVFFHPAGCVYPAEEKITWHGGFVAELLESLINGQNCEMDSCGEKYISLFNWKKFSNNIHQRYVNALEKGQIFSPWCINKEKILLAISSGKFNVYSIKEEKYSTKEFSIQKINDKELNFDESTKIYSKFLLQPVINCRIQENKLIFTLPYTNPQNSYTINPENIFLYKNQLIKLLWNKNNQVTLAITEIEQ